MGTVAGCSGPFLTIDVSASGARSIALVRTVAIEGDPGAPDAYDFFVEEAFKGTVPRQLHLATPQYHACGDRLFAEVGDRFVLFFEVPAPGSGGTLSPYFRVEQGDELSAEGIEATPARWHVVEDLRAVLGTGTIMEQGEHAGVPVPASERTEQPLPIAGLIGAGVAAVVGLIAFVRRRPTSR